MEPELKAIKLDLKAVDGDDPNGEFIAILSTPQLDRDGETVAAGAFDPLPESIPVHYSHDFVTGQPPIGSATPYYEGDTLMVKGRFAPTERAQEFRALVAGEFIKSMSAGFITTKRKGKSILKGDLFEGSLTAVPVNPTAMVLASKALKAETRPARKLKAIVGSVEALQERVRDALEDAYGPWNTCLRGVITADSSIVFDWFTGDGDTYRQAFTDDGAVVTLEGTAVEVDVHEIVVPDADADREATEPTPGEVTLLSVTEQTATEAAAADEESAAAADDTGPLLASSLEHLTSAFS